MILDRWSISGGSAHDMAYATREPSGDSVGSDIDLSRCAISGPMDMLIGSSPGAWCCSRDQPDSGVALVRPTVGPPVSHPIRRPVPHSVIPDEAGIQSQPPSFSPGRESRALTMRQHSHGSAGAPGTWADVPPRPLPHTNTKLNDKQGSGFPLRRERRGTVAGGVTGPALTPGLGPGESPRPTPYGIPPRGGIPTG